jgi:transposase InsO family protein
VTDITYIPTGEGWLYLAVILDLCSRGIVGWAMSERITRQLPLDALGMALGRRRPSPGLLHHSDRGSQGGFMRSSQHLTGASCDDDAETAMFRSIWARQVAIARPTLGGTECGTAAVLGRDCGGALE